MKECNSYTVCGNVNHLEDGCWIALGNYDEKKDDITEYATHHLDADAIEHLIDTLSQYVSNKKTES